MGMSGRVLRGTGLLLLLVWSLFPIYWTVNTSLMTQAVAQSVPAHVVPSPLTWENYREVLGLSPNGPNLWPGFRQSLVNITIECVAATVLTVVISTLAAYGFARLQFRYKTVIFYGVLATMALPPYATLIPLYRIMTHVNLVNTYTGIVLVYTSGFIPLATWILYGQFAAIPRDLEEAALVDGCSRIRALVSIMIPVAMPGIIATAIITFLFGWGQFLFPLVLSTDLTTQPVTVFITALEGQHVVPYTLLSAAGFLAILIPALIVMFLNRYIVSGVAAGSIK